jgi:amino acid adenylation domain-containing protein
MLHRLTSQNKIVIGAPFSGRSISGSQELIGYCVHLLPILSQIDRMSTIEGHLKSTRVTLLEAYQNQDYPFARLINRLNIERDVSRAPLVNTVFNLERIEDTQHIADLNIDMQTQPVSYSRMDLTLTANLRSNEINLECDFNTDLFEQKTIEQFLNVYLNILGQFVKNPQQKIATLPLLCAEDEARQLVSKSELVTSHKLPSFIELFEEHAVLRSDSIALIDETSQQVFTYQHLNQLSNQLARQLIACGAQTDLRIGVCLDRSWQMLVSLLAILKSGSAYVPLDPNYPEQRLSYILKDSGIKILITQQIFLDKFKGLQNHTICFDHEMTTFQTLPKYNLALKNLPLQLAYVIYTSGSSGQPKGVMITHEGFSNYLTWAIKSYNADQFDGSPTLGSFSFDATITSLFVPLAAGNKVILLPTGDELAPLMSLVNTPWHFSFVKITPAHLEILNTLVSADNQAKKPICHKWVLGGEALKPSVANPWLINQQAYIVNEYGPTETVVGCCVFETNKQVDTIFPIGFAIDNIQLFVLDENLELLPPGIPGELYISGLGLARGYLEKATLTASAFIPNQFSHLSPKLGSRLYKTGDRVKFLPNGQLHFLGRKDQQIKLHGYRIELEEIEHALTQISGIREAITLVREVQKDSKLLVAYITSHESLSLDSSDIRSELKKSLPEYMVPTLIITLQSMPLTSHGKIDRQLLPMPVMTDDSAKELGASFNSVENLILDTWRSVLNLEHIQINDNFFDIGGNSLLLLQVFKRLEPQLKTPCEVIDLFKFPTIKQFSAFLSQETTSVKNDQKLIATRSSKQTKALLEKAKKQKSLRAQPIH